jgi:hypothetical protein
MDKKILNDLGNIIKAFNEQLKTQMPLLEIEINEIISSGNTDANAIEHSLDTLLSLTMHGMGDSLFIKLLDYYKTIDVEGAMFYWNEYDTQDD